MHKSLTLISRYFGALLIAISIAACSENQSASSAPQKSGEIDSSTTLAEFNSHIQQPNTVAEPPKLTKLSPAAEKAISEGMVSIKDPVVQACTDKKIEDIKKEKNDPDLMISFEVYNEAAVQCGYNL